MRRRGKPRGLECSGGGRLDDRLAALVRTGRLTGVTFDDIDLFQRIANVESGGQVQALNTWDSGIVSLGFMQLTLRFGELQEWISRAPATFAGYGITVEPSRRYTFTSGKKRESTRAIVGASTTPELRWSPWAERFFNAGLDDDVLAAEARFGQLRNKRHLDRLRHFVARLPGAYGEFLRHYNASAYVRAVFQESYNNRPASALNGTRTALDVARSHGRVSTADFTTLLVDGIGASYAAAGERGKADHIFARTRTGARPDVLSRRPAPASRMGATPGRPATVPGEWDSVRAGSGDIVRVGTINVHRVIAGRVRQMLDAANAAGVVLTGGGFRSPASQISLRRKHCGPTNYDIFEKPSRQCRPPTARPGHSRHEQGLAIDFHLRSGVLSWLKANAGRFGFVNLQSEPWHWSVDGR